MRPEPVTSPSRRLLALLVGDHVPGWLQTAWGLRTALVRQTIQALEAMLPSDDPCGRYAHAVWAHLQAFFASCFRDGELIVQFSATAHAADAAFLVWPYAEQTVIGAPDEPWRLHRDLGRHLQERLDRYLHDQVLPLATLLIPAAVAPDASLSLARDVRRGGHALIAPLAWWETFLLALWETPRPIRETAWVVTLDHVPKGLYADVTGAESQVMEWQRLWPDLIPSDGAVTADDVATWAVQGLAVAVDSRHLPDRTRHRLQASWPEALAPDGLVIVGDNADGLRYLGHSHAGRVDSLYIDPPYNTGGEAFQYHDAYGHATWLTMMRDRLDLAAPLLRPDGELLISCDDHEQHHLRALLDSLALPSPFLANLIWKSRQNVDSRNRSNLSNDHEFILACGQRFRGAAKDLGKYANPDTDPRGPWMSDNMVGLATRERRPNLHYHLLVGTPAQARDLSISWDGHTLALPAARRLTTVAPSRQVLACLSWDRTAIIAWTWLPEDAANAKALPGLYPCPEKGWRYEPASLLHKAADGRILWPAKANGRPRKKTYQGELRSAYTGFSTVVGHTADGTRELTALFGPGLTFNFPKPVSLLTTLLEQTMPVDGTALDYFAGTGTTAHAVIALNRADGGRRRYVLVESAEHADAVLIPRIKKALFAADWKDGRPIEPTGVSHRLQVIWLTAFGELLAGLPWDRLEATLRAGPWPDPLQLAGQLASAPHGLGPSLVPTT
jgi:adenine-specific DNA-methyltransferase